MTGAGWIDRARRWRSIAPAVGIAGLLAGGLGLAGGREDFFPGYLFAFMYWIGLSLGCLFLRLAHELFGGAWGRALRPALDAGALTVVPMAVLAVPLAAGLPRLFPWVGPGAVAGPPFRAAYLDEGFFLARTAMLLVAWAALAWLLSRREARSQPLGIVGMVVYVLTTTIAAVDWIMSAEPGWTSSIVGFMLMSAQALAGSGLAVAAAVTLGRAATGADGIERRLGRDLGNLILLFVLVWANMMLMQYLIMWYGNLPADVTWYLRRSVGGWETTGALMLLASIALPFVLLLSRELKERAEFLRAIGALVAAAQLVSTAWLVLPAYYRDVSSVGWPALALTIGIGGVWAAAFLHRLITVAPGTGEGER